jgi:hypothetical protein
MVLTNASISKDRRITMAQNTLSYPDIITTNPFVLTLLTTPGSAARRIENRVLPPAIQVDETEHREVARRLAAGVQVYDYNPDTGIAKFRVTGHVFVGVPG